MNKSRKAMITGINGQDGSYLAEYLLDNGYQVLGTIRKFNENSPKLTNINHILSRITLFEVKDRYEEFLYCLICEEKPDEIYHLASPSFVSYDFGLGGSELSRQSDAVYRMLVAVKEHVPTSKFYFAGTSEMFGESKSFPQNESTPFNPRSLYGISKLTCYHLCRNFRSKYGLFISTGILYNHESIRRNPSFVTRKITLSAARIKLGKATKIALGNLDAKRDWGYAPEYVQAMWKMLHHYEPTDFVVATGKLSSVREFAEAAFKQVNLNLYDHLETSSEDFRPSEETPLVGNADKANQLLNWHPQRNLQSIINEMVEYDIQLVEGGQM